MAKVDDETKRSLLSKSGLFSTLSLEELDGLLALTRTRTVEKGQVVFLKGDKGEQLYAIASGRLRVSANSEEGKVMSYGIFGPGELIGEIALLDGRERTATVTAMAPSKLLVIDRRDFVPYLEKNPKLAIKMLGALAARVRSASMIAEDSIFLDLPQRLAKKLLALGSKFGIQEKGSIRIDLKLSQQELGNLVGTTRESINKTLKIWEEEGLVQSDHGSLLLVKPDSLQVIAGGALT